MQQAQYPSTRCLLSQLQRTRIAAVEELRHGFEFYGYDVRPYSDDEVSDSVLQASTLCAASSRQLFGCAFLRLANGRR